MSQLPNATTSKKYLLSEVNTIASLLLFHQQLGAIFDAYVDRDGVQHEEVGSIKLSVQSCGTPMLEVSSFEMNDREAFAEMERELARQKAARMRPYHTGKGSAGFRASVHDIGGQRSASEGGPRSDEYGGSFPGSAKPAGKGWEQNGNGRLGGAVIPITGADSDDFFADDGEAATRREIEEMNSDLLNSGIEEEENARVQNERLLQESLERYEDEGGAVLQPLVGDEPDH